MQVLLGVRIGPFFIAFFSPARFQGNRYGKGGAFAHHTLHTEIATHFLTSLAGPLASEKVVDTLLERFKQHRQQRTLKQRGSVFWRTLWLTAKRIKERGAHSDNYSKKKFSGLTIEEIIADIERFQHVTGRFGETRVKQVRNGCFALSK